MFAHSTEYLCLILQPKERLDYAPKPHWQHICCARFNIMANWSDAFDSTTISILPKVAYFAALNWANSCWKSSLAYTYGILCQMWNKYSVILRTMYSSTELGETACVIACQKWISTPPKRNIFTWRRNLALVEVWWWYDHPPRRFTPDWASSSRKTLARWSLQDSAIGTQI